MTTSSTLNRRRPARRGSVRRVQGGAVLRGVIVAMAIVTALALQLAGSRLQSGLADLVGSAGAVPGALPAAAMPSASMPSCGAPSAAFPMHPCKVATATAAGIAPVI